MANKWVSIGKCEYHGEFYADDEETECPACNDGDLKFCPQCKVLVEPVAGHAPWGIYDRCPNCWMDIDNVESIVRDYEKHSGLYLDELEVIGEQEQATPVL